jgi:hypothetical protein
MAEARKPATPALALASATRWPQDRPPVAVTQLQSMCNMTVIGGA